MSMSIIKHKKIGKYNIKSWFTLIEIIIILVVISLILWMTIYFGSENIFKLKYKTAKEEFTSAFNWFYSSSLESNYIKQNRFNTLNLEIFSWNNSIFYSYIWDNYIYTGKKEIDIIQTNNIKVDWASNQNKATIEISPYKLWCTIKDQNNNTWTKLDFQITINQNTKYCMYILSQNCKIIQEICSN